MSETKKGYKNLAIIISLILIATISISIKDSHLKQYDITKSMSYFMSGFFLVFSGFKLLDVKGFADGYSMYDLLAEKVKGYGYVYPFLELFLGIGYIINPMSRLLQLATIVLLGFSSLGVVRSIMQKKKFHCACLGTIIKVPLTHVTLIEDWGMALMALGMLILK